MKHTIPMATCALCLRNSIERGLADSAAGRVHYLGSFTKYLTDKK